jgi:hypothetical protein
MTSPENQNMPSARANGILVEYNQNNNSYLLIGGSDRNQGYNDAWLLLINEKKWEKLNIPQLNEKFSARSGVAYSLIENNENSLILYIHGGQDFFNQTFYSNMILLTIDKTNLEKSSLENLTVLPLDLSKNPCERNSHCMVKDEMSTKLYIFGGGTKEKLLNDLWIYDYDLKKYELLEIKDIDKVIEPRELFGMCLHEDNLIIFGGRLMDGIDKNSYIIDLKNKTCKVGSKMPFALCAFSFAKIKYENKYYIIIYGGTDGNMFSNNFVVYNFSDSSFKKSKHIINKELVNNDPNLSVFLGRISTMMAYDEKNNNIILYGGSACDKEWDIINAVDVKDILDGL